MNYSEAINYIHSINWSFCKPGLERIGELCASLGDPQKSLKFIHVAGTNGKGSFCAMLDSVLRCAGYRVGLFTSPYIVNFNERMRVCGMEITNEELAEITEYVKPYADSMKDKPTEFELITAIGFEYFKRHKCDFVILEAGMGGRLDSTNIIDSSLLSVITGISLDHTVFLGNTLEEIAREKAGIIKCGCPVLYGGDDISVMKVIKGVAEQKRSKLYNTSLEQLKNLSFSLEGTTFDYKARKNIKLSLLGSYQPQNAANVLETIEILTSYGIDIPEKAIYDGLADVMWRARFEILTRTPLVIYDGAHNPQGIDAAIDSIKLYFGDEKVAILSGVMKDKDYAYIARKLSSVAKRAFAVTPDNPRALESSLYAQELNATGIEATHYDTLDIALTDAIEYAIGTNTSLICLGSLYMYSELTEAYNRLYNKK